MKSRTYNTIRNIISGGISYIFVILFPFLVRTIITYKLGEQYVGLGNLFTSLLQVLNVTELGFASAIAYTLYSPIAKKEYTKIVESIALLKTIYYIVGIVITILGMGLLPFLHLFIKGDVPDNVNIYVLFVMYLVNTVISYFFFGYKSTIITAYQRYDVISKINAVISCVRGIFQIIVLISFSNYYLYTIIIPISTVLSNYLVNFYAEKLFPELNVKVPLSLKGLKTIGRQVGGIAIGRIALMCRNSFDSIIISAFLGLSTVAMYSNYYLIFSSITGMMAVFLNAMAASVGNSLATETIQKNELDHRKFDFYYQMMSGFCTICLFALYQPFMKLWVGAKLTFPWTTMVLFCLYFYVNHLSQIRAVYSEAAGIWWDFRFLTIAEMTLNLLFNFILGYLFGVNGILWATIITALIFSFFGCTKITYKKIFKTSMIPFIRNNFFYLIVDVMGCIVIHFITKIFDETSVLVFFVEATITVIVCIVYLLLIYLANRETRKMIMDLSLIKKFKGESI